MPPTSSYAVVEKELLTSEVLKIMRALHPVLKNGPVDVSSSDLLMKCSATASVNDLPEGGLLPFWQADLKVHIFRLSAEGPEQEMIDGVSGDEEVSACLQWELPTARLQGLWESLVMDPTIKSSLLEYATTAMLFADHNVSQHIVSWNRVVLLHGPPGTGKTSLCQALAQKLSIRLSDRYQCGQLLEINAHSLFSKWFSESGKLVQRLWEHIGELADDEDSFICILVDEVESLAAARSAAMRGNEPSDAIRVVNAVLTQIDNLRQRNNVLVLTTSNISQAIDLAFVDRADIKVLIGLPTLPARYAILQSCILELMRVGIIAPLEPLPSFPEIDQSKLPMQNSAAAPPVCPTCGQPDPSKGFRGHVSCNLGHTVGESLFLIAAKAEGLSGRALRKLPFQAHACFVQRPSCTTTVFLTALTHMVVKELSCRDDLAAGCTV